MTERLSEATLPRLGPAVQRPSYDRRALKPGVVHLGLGAFHRAHQAPLFEALAEAGDLRWGITGASLRSPAVRDALQPQDWLYSLLVEEGGQRRPRVIGALKDVIVAPEQPRRVIQAIASLDARVVTVTVTEKGYKLDPASGSLIEGDPDVRSDLASLNSPATLAGYLAAGLKFRSEHGLEPLTIISCDNMSANGRKLQASVVQVARAHDPVLAEWIEEQCAFPNTMVDRIVPATSEADSAVAAAELGLLDRATVRTEPFSQWVIENRFVGARPELDSVQFTSDVAPWEEAKLRLLNGAHSAMAYLGGLAGVQTVDQFVAQPLGSRFIHLLWEEVQPTLSGYCELDLPLYREQLMRRFRNPALNHHLMQIAMDGSQKLPQRLAAPAVELLEAGRLPTTIALAIAAWMRWQSGQNDRGETIIVDDPLASTTRRVLDGVSTAHEQVSALLSIRSIFPERLSADAKFHALVADQLESLQRKGAMATIDRLAQDTVSMQTGVSG